MIVKYNYLPVALRRPKIALGNKLICCRKPEYMEPFMDALANRGIAGSTLTLLKRNTTRTSRALAERREIGTFFVSTSPRSHKSIVILGYPSIRWAYWWVSNSTSIHIHLLPSLQIDLQTVKRATPFRLFPSRPPFQNKATFCLTTYFSRSKALDRISTSA